MRLTRRQRAIVDAAAASQGRTITEYSVNTLVDHSIDVLADQRHFFLNEEQWEAFNAQLEEPPKDLPNLAKLLAKKAPWEK